MLKENNNEDVGTLIHENKKKMTTHKLEENDNAQKKTSYGLVKIEGEEDD
jgi:hypothetical protein